MILFLNFAPLSFGGGVERWIASVAAYVALTEEVNILYVDPKIGNIYAQLVLKRKFDDRFDAKSSSYNQTAITLQSLIPFTQQWRVIRTKIQEARIIYTKLEINETVLILYFGGLKALRKTIIGLHSPFLYIHSERTFLENVHNVVYTSFIVRYFLSVSKKVHVLNPEQEKKIITQLHLTNVTFVPNFIEYEGKFKEASKEGPLKICFIGELSRRKGADILLEIIEGKVPHFSFEIAGDGHLKESFLNVKMSSVKYHGYLDQQGISKIISSSDVLLMPSRAESFSLASLEALSQGLVVVCSSDISPNTLEKYLVINKTGSVDDYITILSDLYLRKKKGSLLTRRRVTSSEIRKKYSKEAILTDLEKNIFN